MKIAICDDNEKFCDHISALIAGYLESIGVPCELYVYHSIQNARFEFAEGMMFDLIFLDIEFVKEEEDGVDLGTYLRDTLENNYSQIVYVSSEEKYAMRGTSREPENAVWLMQDMR